MPVASINQVRLALFQIKTLINKKQCSFEQQRKKNIDTLAELGILPEDVFDLLLELTPENYYKGPSKDYNTDEKDCIWEFGIKINERDIYIKLKLMTDFVKDISFHFAERPLIFPFQNV